MTLSPRNQQIILSNMATKDSDIKGASLDVAGRNDHQYPNNG